MNERTVVKCLVGFLVAVAIVVTGNTDLIYVGASILFFSVCVAYAVWCERL